MDSQAPWKPACRYCGRLAESEECADCRDHFQRTGHYPGTIEHRRPPGQPRVLDRVCGLCGKTLGSRE